MDNIIGKAKDYLEKKGIDTNKMSMEEIITEYQKLLKEESENQEKEQEEVIDDEKSELDVLLEENQEIINSFTDEQSQFFNKVIALFEV